MTSLDIMGPAGRYRLGFNQYSNDKWERIEKFISLPPFVGYLRAESEILAPYLPKDTLLADIALTLIKEEAPDESTT